MHGEAYPSNLLVEASGRIRPLDFETLGIGAAALDLAALTSGAWDPAERDRVVEAYRAASSAPPTAAELDAARLMVALQWLGWSPSWTPPAEHRHDWLAESLRIVHELRL
jgi:thiamine kinase-like enzyme